jgi:hypothetical protein
LLLTLGVAFWYVGQHAPASRVHVVGAGGVALAVVVACTAAYWDATDFLSQVVLLSTWSLFAFILLVASWTASEGQLLPPNWWSAEQCERAARWVAGLLPPAATRRWVRALGTLVVLLALWGVVVNPGPANTSAPATLTISALAGALALWSRQPLYVYASGLLIVVAGWEGWLAWGGDRPVDGFYVLILSLAFAAAVWRVLEAELRRRTLPVDLIGQLPPFSPVAMLLALGLLALVILDGVAADLTQVGPYLGGPLAWVTLATCAVAIVIGLWDRVGPSWGASVLPLYVLGLLACCLTLHELRLPPTRWLWTAAGLLAGQVFLASAISWIACRYDSWLRALRLPAPWPQAWFAPLQAVVAGSVVALSVWMSLDLTNQIDRLAGPGALVVLLAAGVLMAASRSETAAPVWRFTVLGLGVALIVETGWALLGPLGPAPWLHRSVILMATLALMTAAYGVGLPRLFPAASGYVGCGRRLGPILGALASALLLVVLVQEFTLYDPLTRHIPAAPWAVAAVIAGLLVLMAAALAFAVLPGKDPLGLSEKGRTAYVYAAEALLALLLVHLRLSVPDLIPSIVGHYWPLVVMAVAFLGVGLSEFFHRRGWTVLAEPLRRTGVFLPLLPLLAFWVRPLTGLRESLGANLPGLQPLLRYLENLPDSFAMHAGLWFLVGALYGSLAVTRRSYRFALLAALAANFGLWVVFAHHERLSFVLHPQLWLIPLALIVLVAGHVNQDRLTEAQGNALRYLALLLIYLSSTADLFLAGLGDVGLSLVLAVLAVLGVLAGILLRLRAFLFLGVSFLFLVVFARIWHAAVERAQTWVWWASGIVLGVAILALFALFEKRRNDVLHVLDELKKWK